MSLVIWLRVMWRSLRPARTSSCTCNDPRFNELGGFMRGCSVHEERYADA